MDTMREVITHIMRRQVPAPPHAPSEKVRDVVEGHRRLEGDCD